MPFIVQDLIEDNPNLVTVRLKDPVDLALARMIDNDFSQLPIVDEQFRPEGMVTAESILRALKNFGVGLDKLGVEDAKVKADEYGQGHYPGRLPTPDGEIDSRGLEKVVQQLTDITKSRFLNRN